MSFDQIKVELLSHWGGDRSVAESAWASSKDRGDLAARSDDDIRRVVTQIVDLDHGTPKERVWFEFFITCPIYVERQLDKYRQTVQYQDIEVTYNVGELGRGGITQNELSGRYRTIPERFYELPDDVAEIQVRGMGIATDPESWKTDYANHLRWCYEKYALDISNLKAAEHSGLITNAEYKRAREVLRGMLGTAYLTDMRLLCNLRALENLLNQRLAADTQLETRVVAARMYRAVEASGVASETFSRMAHHNGWDGLVMNIEGLTGEAGAHG